MTASAVDPEITRLPVPLAHVGESPRWHAAWKCLFYVDILGCELRSLDPETGHYRSWSSPEPVGGWFPTDGPQLLVAVGTRLVLFDPESGEKTVLTDIAPDSPALRLNDGRCDPRGRLLISTMSRQPPPEEGVGSLFRYAVGSPPVKLLEGLTIPNTLAWSQDGRQVYFSDSLTRTVMRHDYDAETDTLGPGDVFFSFEPGEPGIPDGACTDTDGGVWIAVPRADRIERRLPSGALDRTIAMPVERRPCVPSAAAIFRRYMSPASTITFRRKHATRTWSMALSFRCVPASQACRNHCSGHGNGAGACVSAPCVKRRLRSGSSVANIEASRHKEASMFATSCSRPGSSITAVNAGRRRMGRRCCRLCLRGPWVAMAPTSDGFA